MKKIMLLSGILLFILAGISCAIPSPHSLRGFVIEDDGLTQVEFGTLFSINNTANSFYVLGQTGRPENPGKYVSVVDGDDGNLLVIRAWNLTHEGSRNVSLQGSMYNVNVELNQSRENVVPQIVSSPSLQATEDKEYVYNIEVYDPLDSFVYSLDKSVLTYDYSISDNGILTWTPSNQHVGNNTLTLYVNDSFGSQVSQTIDVFVNPVNDAPVISSQPQSNATEDRPFTYQIIASDPDNENDYSGDDDSLSYGINLAPSSMVVSDTGLLSWTPENNDVGTNEVSLYVSDGKANTTHSFFISVTNVNDAPIIVSEPVLSAVEGIKYTYHVTSVDPDSGDVLSYELQNSPNGMEINFSSGFIEWIPQSSQKGEHTITVFVTDGNLTDTQSFTISVQGNNGAPEFLSVPVTLAYEDTLYEYNIEYTDPDGDYLSVSLEMSPHGAVLSGSSLSWTPNASQIGSNNFIISLYDGVTKVYQSFTITVKNTNDAPIIISSSDVVVEEDSFLVYDINALDEDGDLLQYSVNITGSNVEFNSTDGLLIWQTDNSVAGLNLINISVTDGTAASSRLLYVNVTPVNDLPEISSVPNAVAYVGYPYLYQLIVSDPDNENSIAYDDDVLSYNISRGSADAIINSSGAFLWTPSQYDIGTHNIAINVSDGSGYVQQAFVLSVQSIQAIPVSPENAPSSGGGSGGGGSGGGAGFSLSGMSDQEIEKMLESAEFMAAVERIQSKQPAKLKVDDEELGITEFELSVNKDVQGAKLKVVSLSSRPYTITDNPGSGEVYRYLRIDKLNLTNDIIDNAKIKFKVNKSFVKESSKDPQDVVMSRFNEGQWEQLPTLIVDEDNEYYYYESDSEGFSYFAINFRKARPTIIGNTEIVANVLHVPYHLYGIFFAAGGRSEVLQGTEYVFKNLNNSVKSIGTTGISSTGKGNKDGSFNVLIEGSSGDLIRVKAGSWTDEFVLAGDQNINFTTDHEPGLSLPWPDSSPSYYKYIIPCIAILIILVTILMIIKRNKYKQHAKTTGQESTGPVMISGTNNHEDHDAGDVPGRAKDQLNRYVKYEQKNEGQDEKK